MRVFLAGLFVMAMVFGTAGLLSSWSGEGGAPLWLRLVVYAVLGATVLIAMQVFNRRGSRPGDYPRRPGGMKGVLAWFNLRSRESFSARRAFRIEPVRGLGPIYFVELADGSVLYLHGQYLHEYEPGENQPRRFPCTGFQAFRQRVTGDVFDFHCAGEAFEPEFNAPCLSQEQLKRKMPRNGAIITDLTYDQLKREHQHQGGPG